MAQGVFWIVSSVATVVSSVYRKSERFITELTCSVAGVGATLVGVADSAGYFTTSTVEAALAELQSMGARVITDPGNAGAIPVTRSGTCPIVTTGAQTRTLAAPTFINQRLVLYFQTDGGDCVVTVAGTINVAGNNTITLNDANDTIQLVAVYNGSALRWRVAENDGCALSTV